MGIFMKWRRMPAGMLRRIDAKMMNVDNADMTKGSAAVTQVAEPTELVGADEAQLEELFGLVADAIEHGATFREMYGISSETMEAVYAQAYALYQAGRLDEAESFFRFLCIYDFQNVDYILGLAAVMQISKRYDKALDLYAMAYTVSGGDARALLYAGQCNLLLRRRGKAKRCFEILLAQEATDARIRAKAQGYLDALRAGTSTADAACDGQAQ
ncbi:SycD/LcrH family type III secretion system chaperone [Burkholderia ambifaria]|uniref:SycD/LcrH family type III secretion system chaperone n=1 Tax=Burkholderia ambifaria TaxID=152480 RepID=UPI001FC7CE78|nr:SycD/LcrH family type III secretion system chaperone [Burkholderia ambifaria]